MSEKKLDKYNSKRDFDKTPEPPARIGEGEGQLFVIQEHHARQLHWDLRLERDGVLKSWAVPKEPTMERGVRRLAVAVEDHPIDYANFTGDIPEGQYGAGRVEIWDKGTYEAEYWGEDKIVFSFNGTRLVGRFALIHTSAKNWILMKTKEPDES